MNASKVSVLPASAPGLGGLAAPLPKAARLVGRWPRHGHGHLPRCAFEGVPHCQRRKKSRTASQATDFKGFFHYNLGSSRRLGSARRPRHTAQRCTFEARRKTQCTWTTPCSPSRNRWRRCWPGGKANRCWAPAPPDPLPRSSLSALLGALVLEVVSPNRGFAATTKSIKFFHQLPQSRGRPLGRRN